MLKVVLLNLLNIEWNQVMIFEVAFCNGFSTWELESFHRFQKTKKMEIWRKINPASAPETNIHKMECRILKSSSTGSVKIRSKFTSTTTIRWLFTKNQNRWPNQWNPYHFICFRIQNMLRFVLYILANSCDCALAFYFS